MKRIFVAVIFCISFFLSWKAVGWLLHPTDVISGMSTKPWPDKVTLAGDVTLEVPVALTPTKMDWPPEVLAVISGSANNMYENGNVCLIASTVSYRPGVTLDLNGAADGAISSVRAVQDTESVEGTKRELSILGNSAVESDSLVVRSGHRLSMHGLYFIRQQTLYQVIFVVPEEQKETKVTWERMKASLRLINHVN